MARHQIVCPIVKSSNDFGYSMPIAHTFYDSIFMTPIAVSNTLAVAFRGAGQPKSRIGIAWDDSLVPKNKTLVSAELTYYGTRGHGNTVFYRYADFAEGSSIPSHEPSDGSVSGGAQTGWKTISLGKPKGNSVILYADLGTWICPIYDPNGQYVGSRNAAESWEFYSQRSSTNQPYITIVYDDIPPDPPSSLYPSGGTVSTRDIIKFAWVHNSKENLQQKGFELQYSTNGGTSWTTINQTTANQYYDMPANTLPVSGTVTWRVKTWDVVGIESNYSTTTFTLGILPQKAPVPVSPIGQYVSEKKPIRFEWVFIGGSAGETQSKFDLQYSTNNGSTWTTKSEVTEDTFYILPAGTVGTGNILWRARTYNNWNEVSPYSEDKSFTIIGSPTAPLITTVTNSGRPAINWQATDQHIYELEILKDEELMFTTGSLPSTTEKSFKLPIYLIDGSYRARLRIYNEYNLSSPWGEKTFVIATTKPQQSDARLYSGEYGVTILSGETSLKTLIYRDGEPIGETKGRLVDYTGENGREYQYFIRTVNENDNFSDSEIKLAKCKFAGNTIAIKDNPSDFVKLEYGLDERMRKTGRISRHGGVTYYDGRKYPVAEYSEFKSADKSISAVLRTKEEARKLRDMILSGKTLLYRDSNGENIIGAIFDLDIEPIDFGYFNVSFTITRTE